MGRGNILISNFTGGEVSPRLYARPGVSQVANGLKLAENAMIALQGGAFKRTGTRFVIDLPSTARHRFIKFQFSTEQGYMLILGNQYMWIAKNKGILTETTKTITGATKASPCVLTVTGHGYSNGDKVYVTSVGGMTELNNRWFTVAGATTDTFQLSGIDSSAYTTFTSGGSVGKIVEVTTPWTTAQLPRIQTVQVNNVMYMVHPSHAIRKLTRVSDTSWTLATVRPETGPFRDINTTESLTITPSSFSTSATAFGTYTVGTTCTLTAASSLFDADMVDGFFRLYEPGLASGVPEPALGTNHDLDNGDTYTYRGNVYGISNVGGGLGRWENVTRVPEHESGTVRVTVNPTAGGSYGGQFDTTFLHPGYCIVKITAVASATSATAEIVQHQMPASIVSTGTSFWEEGAWSDYRGYPGAVCRFEQRLFLSGATAEPATIWGSRSGILENFEDGVDDDDAVTYRLASDSGDVVRWLAGRRALTAGTSGGEFVIAASSDQEALTPTNFKAIQQDDIGSSDVLPIVIGQSVMFPEREGNPDNLAIRLRQYSYSFSRDRFEAVDLTVFSEHIFGSGITKLGFARSPEELVWVLRDDGQLVACTYKPDQEAVPWHRHVLGGDGTHVAKELAVTAGDDDDELWVQVNRTVNSTAVSYVEVLTPRFRENVTAKADGVFLDASLTYDGAETSTVSGLWHLRGETVSVLADGVVFHDVEVSSTGTITLPGTPAFEAGTIHVGYPYTFKIETQEIEAAAQGGTAQSRAKRISQVWLRVLQSLGGKIGPDASNLKDIDYRIESNPMDASPPLQDGYFELDMKSGWDRELSVRIEQSEPLPFHVTGIVAELSTSG